MPYVETADTFKSTFGREKDLSRASWMALAVTLFAHLLLILILPERFILVESKGEERVNAAENTMYEIDLVDPESMRYVEANPDAPENEPDRSDQYSYRSQQAADESPLSDAMNQPQVDGTESSQKIIEGSLEQSPPMEPGLYAPERRPGEGEGTEGGPPAESAEAVVPPVAQALPPPDFIQQEPVDEVGPGSRVDLSGEALEVPPETEVDAPVNVYRSPPNEGVAEVEQAGAGGGPEVTPRPRARPRLAPELITGPLMRSEGSASRRGTLAIDATFSEFGEYEQQFYAAIQTGWYQEIEFFQPIDTSTRVHVRFTLASSGEVLNIETVQTNASEIARVICESAISKRSPFRPWTKEMVAVFGQSRTLNVVFHYR